MLRENIPGCFEMSSYNYFLLLGTFSTTRNRQLGLDLIFHNLFYPFLISTSFKYLLCIEES